MKFKKVTLNNGLKVIAHSDKSSPLICLNVLYDVGARDEDENRTGFAHLFEHLMFGGSRNVPDYDEVLQLAGGTNNAFTNNDVTNYYLTVPPENIETAFFIESDRMRELAFSQRSLDVQKSVVVEEYKQSYLNQSYGDVSLFLRPLAYKKHPYKWSTIGKNIEHIQGAELKDVKDFFYKYYAPNNAVVTVTGNINEDEAIALAEKYFGCIEKRDVPIRNLPIEPKQTKKRSMILDRDVPSNAIYMAYHTCGRLDKDFFDTDIISDILANGSSSRFNINLVKGKRLFSELNAYIYGSIDPGLLIISGKLHDSTSFDQAESEIKNELTNICEGNFEDRELQKTINRVTATQNISLANITNKAFEIAYSELLGDVEIINNQEKRYRQVSKSSLTNTAKSILKDSNLSCIYYKSIQ